MTCGVHTIRPLPNAETIEVFCEYVIEGGGFRFLPLSLTLRSDAQQIVDFLFKDKKNLLLKLRKKGDGREWYTLIQPHPDYVDIDFGVLENNSSGYTPPRNKCMSKYFLFGIFPKVSGNRNITLEFRFSREVVQFKNCKGNCNIAVDWQLKARPSAFLEITMPQEFFFLTASQFEECHCFTSMNRSYKLCINATAIGIR